MQRESFSNYAFKPLIPFFWGDSTLSVTVSTCCTGQKAVFVHYISLSLSLLNTDAESGGGGTIWG